MPKPPKPGQLQNDQQVPIAFRPPLSLNNSHENDVVVGTRRRQSSGFSRETQNVSSTVTITNKEIEDFMIAIASC